MNGYSGRGIVYSKGYKCFVYQIIDQALNQGSKLVRVITCPLPFDLLGKLFTVTGCIGFKTAKCYSNKPYFSVILVLIFRNFSLLPGSPELFTCVPEITSTLRISAGSIKISSGLLTSV